MTAIARRAAIPFGVAALLLLAARPATGCECGDTPVATKWKHSEVVFRGTLIELRAVKPKPRLGGEVAKIAVFSVSRVWKGSVGARFEMAGDPEGGACWGFSPRFLKVGQELLVFASRISGQHHETQICGFHQPPGYSAKDLAFLGPGKPPQISTGTRQ